MPERPGDGNGAVAWHLRAKDPDQIRADALATAAKKLRGGCAPCAEAYLDLARTHGATEEQIRAALEMM